jgi:hypothetical protein
MKKVKAKENVLAYGEATGHSHRVTVDVYEREDGLREFSGSTRITHEEHKPIEIPAGNWCSGIVQEYDHVSKKLRNVQD